ncbi:hypothetical protein OAT73_03520 [Candidatus Poseidoniaceae archaeon]|nr:hypothetical protein [Euryarchaeota archaeon]MDA9829270.1 hypothetical protein [Candidatus Poseidoniaceae archaeon]MDC3236310.1 hypothetical protein [Candidatus Poseidoniaceae archaeon]
MTSSNDLLKKLLAGDFSPEEIAGDPVLVSLADRIYGIKISPVTPVKPRDAQSIDSAIAAPITEVAPPTDMLIEVIGDIAPATALPMPSAEIPVAAEVRVAKKSNNLARLLMVGLGAVVLNLFGVWSSVFGSMCEAGDLCPTDGYTRINLMEAYKINTGYGWSEPVQTGIYGIPDIVAVVVLTGALFLSMRK